jgi:hypothetical protein
MPTVLATAGGFGGEYHRESLALAPDAVPKLIAMGVLVALLALWAWSYLRSLDS